MVAAAIRSLRPKFVTMSDEQTNFKVTDRRLFNPDGTPREVAAEEAPKPESPVEAAAPSPALYGFKRNALSGERKAGSAAAAGRGQPPAGTDEDEFRRT